MKNEGGVADTNFVTEDGQHENNISPPYEGGDIINHTSFYIP